MKPQSYPVTEAFRGLRLDRFLQEMLPRMSRASIQEAITSRVTLSSGAAPKAARRLAVGEVVTIAPRSGGSALASADIPVLLDAGGWLVIDKPSGISSIPTARRPGEDVVSILGLAPAHRLDRFTTGCLLLTRDAEAARFFEAAFREGRVAKEYVAVVFGEPREDTFTIDAPLGSDASSRVPGRMAVTPEGARAVTDVVVLERFADRALVRAQPRTGRRHQIRAHLGAAGHPIVGDLLYGGDERRFIRLQLGQSVETPEGLAPGRHLLHARALSFDDPSGARRRVESPLPPDFGV